MVTPKRKSTRAKKKKASPAKKKAAAGGGTKEGRKARVRMYRHGVGDCHLVTLGADFHILIDCGLLQSTGKAAEAKLGEALDDIFEETGGRIDVLVATHEHWDHLSGFLQHEAKIDRLTVGEVWMAWTEDPTDTLAKKLAGEREETVEGLKLAAEKIEAHAEALHGVDKVEQQSLAHGVKQVLSFLAAEPSQRMTTRAMLEKVRSLAPDAPRYCRPTDPPWTSKRVPGVRIYTLGPPQDERAIKRLMVKDEVYHAADAVMAGAFRARLEGQTDVDDTLDRLEPFEAEHRRDLEQLRELAKDPETDEPLANLLRENYFGVDPWRSIDQLWLEDAQEFALKLDNATNNTSLVLAIELGDRGRVLLFAADAQVGSWLTWQDLAWTVDGKVVKGTDLLARTVFYKVGHHGSHNATLKAKGLEQMTSDELVAFIPVDEQMAKSKRWNGMPLPGLVSALNKQTRNRVARSDQPLPANVTWAKEDSKGRYFEFEVR